MPRILYLGQAAGTSQHRADTLRRLGHEVEHVDPWSLLPQVSFLQKVTGKIIYEFGAEMFDGKVRRRLLGSKANRSYDLIWIDGGELFGPSTVAELKHRAPLVVSYNIDDPFGPRDRRRFTLYRKAVPWYDLLVVVREVNVAEAIHSGARRVLRVFRSADERAHAPTTMDADERARWAGEVRFIGTWMPERGAILARLLELGVPLSIYGNRWFKAREWKQLKKVWAGPELVGSDYVKAIQASKVCLGLVSKGNRDEHTTRSIEVPFVGSVLCAERTREHLTMYEEGTEAVFWETSEECAAKCHQLLRDETFRQQVARAGQERCRKNGFLNERIVSNVVQAAFGSAHREQ